MARDRKWQIFKILFSDHCYPYISILWPSLDFHNSIEGIYMIIHNGNIYQQRSQFKDGRISYRCSLYHQRTGSCKATLVTDSQRSLILAESPHNHRDRSPSTLDSKRTIHRLKEMYDGSRPVRIHAQELGIPANSTMRMRCHRIRKRTESGHQRTSH